MDLHDQNQVPFDSGVMLNWSRVFPVHDAMRCDAMQRDYFQTEHLFFNFDTLEISICRHIRMQGKAQAWKITMQAEVTTLDVLP